jgi:putrescine aminotransferase
MKEISSHPLVGEARSVGLIGALELVRDKKSRRFFDKLGEVGTICRDFCFQNGLIMRATRDTMIISPPLVINREQIDELAEKAWRCLDLTLARCQRGGGRSRSYARLGPPLRYTANLVSRPRWGIQQ